MMIKSLRSFGVILLTAWLCGSCTSGTTTEISSRLQLTKGKATSLGPDSLLGVTLVATDVPGQRALLSITNLDERALKSGWVEVGHYADFSPWNGAHGLRLLSVERSSAVIESRGALISQ